MRILKFLFLSAFSFSVIVVLGFLVTREVLLQMGVSTLAGALREIRNAQVRNNSAVLSECLKRGASQDNALISRWQLRFRNDQQFATEAVCYQFPSDPVVMTSYQLPQFVRKVAGVSGMVWGDDPSGIYIQVWGRTAAIALIDQEIITSRWPGQRMPPATAWAQPTATCEGYGYACCNAETHQGTGGENTSASDCPKSCFAVCQPRPVILSFGSDPFPDVKTKTITIGRGEAVTFSYVSSVEGIPQKDAQTVKVVLNYGDGQEETFTTLNGETSHTFQCPSGGCMFGVTVSVQLASGLMSAVTPTSQIRVQVQ